VTGETEAGVTRTDQDGRFVAVGNIQGRSRLLVRSIGYQAR
jgi:hypothetical protein